MVNVTPGIPEEFIEKLDVFQNSNLSPVGKLSSEEMGNVKFNSPRLFGDETF
jgi:hypothetical protein